MRILNALNRKLDASQSIQPAQLSWAQCGEDIIVDFIFSGLKMSGWTYLDIGAGRPAHMSNTYLAYTRGQRGVLVEPNPALAKELRHVRPGDKVIPAGLVAGPTGLASFYRMKSDTLSTFSEDVAKCYESYGQQVDKTESVRVINAAELMAECYPQTGPNFISLDIEDTEGGVVALLKALRLDVYRPEVLCVETLTYSENRDERKMPEITEYLEAWDYFRYADTFINSIFVRREAWGAR